MKTPQIDAANTCNSCSFMRRIGCMVYDLVVVFALWMLAGLPVVFIHSGAVESGTLWFQSYLLSVSALYFIWSWQRGGQTLGMRAWHVHVINQSGDKPSLKQAISRFITSLLSSAALALGWLWALGHPLSLTWHDLLSSTRLVVIKKSSQHA